MFENPSKSLMIALRDFLFGHEIFVEARELDDGLLFVRPTDGAVEEMYLFSASAERVPTFHITPHELTVKHDDHEGHKEHEEEPTKTTVSRCLTPRRSRAGPRAGDARRDRRQSWCPSSCSSCASCS